MLLLIYFSRHVFCIATVFKKYLFAFQHYNIHVNFKKKKCDRTSMVDLKMMQCKHNVFAMAQNYMSDLDTIHNRVLQIQPQRLMNTRFRVQNKKKTGKVQKGKQFFSQQLAVKRLFDSLIQGILCKVMFLRVKSIFLQKPAVEYKVSNDTQSVCIFRE